MSKHRELSTAAKPDSGRAGSGTILGRASFRMLHLFSSVKLAIVLIIILALLSLIGALIIQVPVDSFSSAGDYEHWFAHEAAAKYGGWATPMSWLQLFDIFHSFWFLAAGFFLMVNILVCSLSRWRNLRQIIRGGAIRNAEAFYRSGVRHHEFNNLPGSAGRLTETLTAALHSRHYRVRVESEEERVYLAADKNRFPRLGTLFVHLSLILLVLGFITGSYLGFRDNSFVVVEGETQAVGHDTGLELSLTSFQDDYWPDGAPKDYRSEIILYDSGSEVERGIIRVNSPLSYNGIRFYQAFFGPAAIVRIKDKSGRLLFDGGLALSEPVADSSYQRFVGIIDIPGTGMAAALVSSAVNASDPFIKKGSLGIQLADLNSEQVFDMRILEANVPLEIRDWEFTYLGEAQYSGFQVNHDPGNSLIWIASGLFMAGLAMVLYLPHRQFWAMAISRPDGSTRLLIRENIARGLNSDSDMPVLEKAMEGGETRKTKQTLIAKL